MRRICLRFSSCFVLFFAYVHSLFVLCVLFACFVCSCVLGCLCFLLWVCCWVFFFPFGLYAKRKGAPCWCVLSSCVVGCFIWLLLCIPRTRQVSARLYRNKVSEKGNLIECSKLFCARLCSYLCSSKFVFLLFSYLVLLVGSYFLFPFGGVGLFICLVPL